MNPDLRGRRIAILGIGNELNGDDGAGVSVARILIKSLEGRGFLWEKSTQNSSGAGPKKFLIVEAGQAPENFSGLLRRFQPEWVIMVDAGDMGRPPGTVAWLQSSEIGMSGGSTHVLSPAVLAKFLADELGCQVAFIGIQPQSLEFGSSLSLVVRQAVEKIAGDLVEILLF